jgi:VWFA-related protein
LACALAAQDTPTFRTSTRLVQVDVVVKAKDAPVGGLTKDDFQVFDNGKPQQIAVFSVREANAARPEPVPLPKGVVSNRPRYLGPEPVAATVVLMDQQNTHPEYQGYARIQALKYLDQAGRRELVAVYALDSTLKVLQEFTEDRASLRKAVDGYTMVQSLNLQDGSNGTPGLLTGLTGNGANAMRAANFQRQADITTAAFESLARHLAGLPGRKKLIWITAAMPLTFTQENERNGVMMTEFTNLSKQIYAPMKLLNDANVAIYPIDPRGVMTPAMGAGLMDPGITTMVRLAELTGGRAAYNDNDLAAVLEDAFGDTYLTYTLGFYPSEGKLDGSTHAILVKVNRSGVDARYRQSYSAETAAKPLTEKFLKAALSERVNQPLEATEIPIQAAAVAAVGKAGYYDVEVGIDVSALQLELQNGLYTGSVEIAIVPDVENKPKGLDQVVKVNLTQPRLLAALESGMTIINQVRVTNNKGKLLAKKLHVVVMDRATGKTGSVRIPIVGN